MSEEYVLEQAKGENQQQTQPTKDIAPGFEKFRPHWWDLNALQITQSLLKRNLIVKLTSICWRIKQSFSYQWLHTKPRCQAEA